MQAIKIPYIQHLSPAEMEDAVRCLSEEGAELLVDKVNWPESFPYAPETKVRVAHTEEHLFILYKVRGLQLRALAVKDHQNVWEDSCVEFFCRVPGSAYYMNFESNCIGTMTVSRRISKKEDVHKLQAEEMAQIQRWTTCKPQCIEEQNGEFLWQVALAIPLSLIFRRPLNFPETLEANFYKCADKTRYPHFVSWSPITLPTPNFHCPQFFGRMVLE